MTTAVLIPGLRITRFSSAPPNEPAAGTSQPLAEVESPLDMATPFSLDRTKVATTGAALMTLTAILPGATSARSSQTWPRAGMEPVM